MIDLRSALVMQFATLSPSIIQRHFELKGARKLWITIPFLFFIVGNILATSIFFIAIWLRSGPSSFPLKKKFHRKEGRRNIIIIRGRTKLNLLCWPWRARVVCERRKLTALSTEKPPVFWVRLVDPVGQFPSPLSLAQHSIYVEYIAF